MQVLHLSQGQDLAIGLEWEVAFSGIMRPALLRAKARKHKASLYVRHAALGSREAVYGFLPGAKASAPALKLRRKSGTKTKTPSGKPGTGLLALGSLVALGSNDTFAFLAPLGAGRMGFIGVLSGKPIQEVADTEDKALAALQAFASSHQTLDVRFSPLIGRPAVRIEGVELSELDLALPAAGQPSALELKPLPRAGLGLLETTGILVVAGAAGVFGLIWHQKQQEQARLAAAQQQLTPQQIYANNKAQALRTLPMAQARSAGQAMAQAVLALPVTTAGWRLNMVECSAEGPAPRCVAKWVPAHNAATYAQFAAQWRGTAVNRVSLREIDTQVQLPAGDVEAVDIAHGLPGAQEFLRRDGSFFQAVSPLKFDTRIGGLDLVGGPDKPPVPGMLDRAPWDVKGPLTLLPTFFTALPPNMALTRLQVVVPSKPDVVPQFEAQGMLYVARS